LSDKDTIIATRTTKTTDQEKIRTSANQNEEAKQRLITKYQNNQLTKQDIEIVLDSIRDSISYALANRHPVDRMIDYLHHFFRRDQPLDPKLSLQITNGQGGSCLSHTHSTQFQFVHQSLLLWREIQHNMFRLWKAADTDLLGSSSYTYVNTGQGLNRVQSAPHVERVMSEILSTVKSKIQSGWVGLSVVHLGDRDVPNALVFINKYCQVPSILGPIVDTLDRLKSLSKLDSHVKVFIQMYGEGHVKTAQNYILWDFFRHGFDGSGDDGGSCIDGRLTSAWNWCSKIEQKSYYPLFMLTGFIGFDGSFRR